MSVILSRGDNRVGGVSSDAVLRREYAKRMTAPGQAVLRRHGAAPIWTPASLFENGEQGALYDPSDFSTMFQDSAGTTPVTAVEQPVGLILDKRLGLELGVEMIVGAPTVSGGASYAGGELTVTGAASSYGAFSTTGAHTSGDWYEITFNVLEVVTGNAGSLRFGVPGDASMHGVAYLNTTGPKKFVFRANHASQPVVIFLQADPGTGQTRVSDVSTKKLPGNHRTAPNSAGRAVLKTEGGKYGLQYDGVDDGYTSTPTLGDVPVTTYMARVSIDPADTGGGVLIFGYDTGEEFAFAYSQGSGSSLLIGTGVATPTQTVNGAVAATRGELYTQLTAGWCTAKLTGKFAAPPKWAGVRIGNYPDYEVAGKVGREILINRALTPDELANVAAWLEQTP